MKGKKLFGLLFLVLSLAVVGVAPVFAATTDGTVDFTGVNSQITNVTSGFQAQIPTFLGIALGVAGLMFGARLGWRFVKGLAQKH